MLFRGQSACMNISGKLETLKWLLRYFSLRGGLLSSDGQFLFDFPNYVIPRYVIVVELVHNKPQPYDLFDSTSDIYDVEFYNIKIVIIIGCEPLHILNMLVNIGCTTTTGYYNIGGNNYTSVQQTNILLIWSPVN